MSVYDRQTGKRFVPLKWEVGVPVGSNPLIIIDFLSLILVIWGISYLVIIAAQLFFGGEVGKPQLWGAAVLSTDMAVLCVIFYLFTCFVIMRNRYAARYRLDEHGAYCDNIKAFPKAIRKALLHLKGYPIEMPKRQGKVVPRSCPWTDVRHVVEVRELGVIVLRGRWGALMRIYTPDLKTYMEAMEFIAERLASEALRKAKYGE